MYRIFCESYENFKKSFNEENYRLKIAMPFELIVDVNRYNKEKEEKSILYKKSCDLLEFMSENIKKYPKFEAFLWTLSSRNMVAKKYKVSSKEELEEQAKLVNSFLKLVYWY